MEDAGLQRVIRVVGRVKFECLGVRFYFLVERDKAALPLGVGVGRVYVQVGYVAPCSRTGQVQGFKGRKWYLSDYMTDDEILKTCFAACKVAAEHEVLEGFRVDGRVPFNPHVLVGALLTVSDCEIYREG